jgi:hypothetical protein
MRVYPLDEPYRPAPGHNNIWLKVRNPDHVIVFVHGVLSDSHGCWYRERSGVDPGVYWPGLIDKDPRFDKYSIYLGGYQTSVKSGPYEVSDCAEELFTALNRPGEDNRGAVLDRETIVFVCHSMGGVVVRYMLSAHSAPFRDKKVGLSLIASPSAGSVWANRLDLLLRYFKHEQGKSLKWGSWNLKDLDDRFQLILEDQAIPQLFGREACEHHFVIAKSWLPPAEALVPRDSAGRYFGRVRMLADTDHFTCVKPKSKEDPGYQFLVDFCRLMDKAQANPRERRTPAPSAVPSASSQTPAPVCRGLHWDVIVDEEGDAYNEMTYFGIVLPPGSSPVLPLPPAEIQSGHISTLELVRDSRTPEGVTLEQSPAGGMVLRRIESKVTFTNRPTDAHPSSFCLSNHDWNAYSMNMEEYRQKPGWREDGLDYVEKAIPETWDSFTLLMRFPEQMIFAKLPFFEIYSYLNGEPVRDDALTAKLQNCFYYSKSQRTAVLHLLQPPVPSSCRIAWLLGESPVAVTSALVPKQRQRQRMFAKKLLRMRRALLTDASSGRESPTALASAQELHSTVKSVLASVAEYIEELLGEQEPLDPETLELSLMVLDEEQMEEAEPGGRKLPVLRIVAGTHANDPKYRDLALFVGDGNAGRAWKRRMARVFDSIEKDPKRHIYVPISEDLRHRFLVSIPILDPDSAALVYGILNIGTFSDSQAEVLRPLGEKEQVEKLTGYAQAFVLTRLIESLKIK